MSKISNILLIRNLFFYAFFLLLFVFPFASPHALIMSLLLSFFTKDLKIKIQPIDILLMLFFCSYLVSGFYSQNLVAWSASIELKASFLIFPFVFPAALRAKKVSIEKITLALTMGAIILFLICSVRALVLFNIDSSIKHFFSSAFTYYIHPTYLAVMLNLLLFMVVRYIENSKLKAISFGIFILFILLASSKIGLILLVINIVFLSYQFFLTRKKTLLFSLIILFIGCSSFLSYQFVPIINSKFNYAVEETFNKNYEDKSIKLSSTGQRIVAWKASKNIIKNNFWIGVGSGDIKDELNKEYNRMAYEHMKPNLDSHQQFLQTFASTGVFGFFILIMIFILLFIKSLKKKSFLLLVFSVNLLLFSLTESMLETQAGVFTFLVFLYVFDLK